MCDIVQEGERVQSAVDASGTSYLLIQEASSWTAARQTCLDQGGTIANVRTQAQYEQILALMDQTGVNNAWICNEVASPGASTGQAGDFTAWGSDVNMPASGSSGYYEPARELAVVRGTCPGPLSGRPFVGNTVPATGPDCPMTVLSGELCGDASTVKQNYYRGGVCGAGGSSDNAICTNCCSHQQKVDSECNSGKCDTGTQLTHQQRECYCSTCPAGKRVRFNPIEQDYINSEHDVYTGSGIDRHLTDERTVRNPVTTQQTYEGPMCGFARRRFDAVSSQWTSDWGEGECHDSMPFICAIGDQAVVDNAWMGQFDHCHPYNAAVAPLVAECPLCHGRCSGCVKASAANAQAIATLLGIVVPMIGLVWRV